MHRNSVHIFKIIYSFLVTKFCIVCPHFVFCFWEAFVFKYLNSFDHQLSTYASHSPFPILIQHSWIISLSSFGEGCFLLIIKMALFVCWLDLVLKKNPMKGFLLSLSVEGSASWYCCVMREEVHTDF